MSLSVLYGCDDRYAPFAGVSITSLFENNRIVDHITVYVAAMDFSPDNTRKFQMLAAQYGREIVFLDTMKAVAQMNAFHCSSWNGSIATWLRFFVLDMIPDPVDRLIWIDSDTIVEGGLERIVDAIPDDSPIAAVCDCIAYRLRLYLGFEMDEPYFNAGVIVFNMPYLRRNGLFEQIMRHIAENAERYLAADQDMMNVFFRGKIVKLHPRYNNQCFLKAYSIEDYFCVYPWLTEAYYTPKQILESMESPVIIHFFRFLGDYPWQQGKNYHPAKHLYDKWKQKSLWKDHPGLAERKELFFRVEKMLYKLLPRRAFLWVFARYTNRGFPNANQ